MRTIENWNANVHQKVLKTLPLRLQKDLVEFPPPKKLPKLQSYFIHGNAGVGKTVLAARLYMEAKKQHYLNPCPDHILFLSTSEFFNELKSSFNNSELDEQVILAKYSEAEFLVLDDLGSERSTEWVMSMLYLLINRRYESMLTTIITSNYDLDELDEKLDDVRIPSRIGRMCKVLNPVR